MRSHFGGATIEIEYGMIEDRALGRFFMATSTFFGVSMTRGGVMSKIGEMIREAVYSPSQLIQRMNHLGSVLLLVVIGLSFVGNSVAWGADTPTQAVQKTIDQVLAVLGDEQLKDPGRVAERREKLEAIIAQRFDYEEAAKRALGRREWKKLSEEKQQEFVVLFQKFFTQTYAGNVDGYSGETVEYIKEQRKGDFAEVRTKIISSKSQIPLNYRLLKKQGKWKVFNVIIDNVNLMKNYSSQFSRIIKSSSFEGLLDELRSKTDLAASS